MAMRAFHYRDGQLYCDHVPLARVAQEMGTPLHVYSRRDLEARLQALEDGFGVTPHLICYALKANSNPHLLRILAQKGCGADVVSGGELALALRAGVPPDRIVFAGVGKTDVEIEQALQKNILALNLESLVELEIVQGLAHKLGKCARVALRVNPDIDARTHPYISTGLRQNKFGIALEQVPRALELAASLSAIEVRGLHCHLGSMIMQVEPYVQAAHALANLARRMRAIGLPLEHVDLGGGLGVDYSRVVMNGPPAPIGGHLTDEPTEPPTPQELFRAVGPVFEGMGLRLLFEPGRYLVANCGALITRVTLTKQTAVKKFVVVDAAMNDLIRPCLYHAQHQIVPLCQKESPWETVDVVGPICESADFLAQGRALPRIERGELLAVMSTGAYGYALSSNYNARPRLPEVLVEGASYRLIREREQMEDLWRGVPPL